ncbi:hypothetical protein SAMN05660733_07782 [Lentzea albidocapillata]|uniref:Uncharacterized protein n=1 Tax=Lentzea albidocapillata TaxID=40571 RepID=A0A1W2FSP8_9PSEU|nr:hypothetical protein SAMN05660733_07782 [Lentzea albidocapillata]
MLCGLEIQEQRSRDQPYTREKGEGSGSRFRSSALFFTHTAIIAARNQKDDTSG